MYSEQWDILQWGYLNHGNAKKIERSDVTAHFVQLDDWFGRLYVLSTHELSDYTPEYKCVLEYTYDDIFAAGFVQSGATWFNHPTLAAAQTATKDAQFTFPVTGIRINQTSGTGSTAAIVLQAGLQ